MVKKGPSQSAGIIAAHRALESSKNPEERICYDSLARDFLPKGFTVIGKHEISEKDALDIFQQIVPGFHEFFIARTRYIDNYLKQFIKRGFQQLVILGAGYDSRAYRLDGLNKNINVFEVDNHATQSIKKKKVNEIFNELPDYVTYVSVDLQNDNLESCLTQNGYDSQLKTFFILEGVTMYVDPKTVDGTLSFISKNTAKGSEIMFDYTYPEVISGTCERKEAQEWLRIAQK